MRVPAIMILTVCVSGCAVSHPSNSAQLWHLPKSRITSIAASDKATIARMAQGTAPIETTVAKVENNEFHMTTENPLNRYVPLAVDMEQATESADGPLVAEAIDLADGSSPQAIETGSAKQLGQPEPIQQDNSLMLDLEKALKLAGGLEAAENGRLLRTALHYMDMIEAIHHSRIAEEALQDTRGLATICAELPQSVEEHQLTAERLQTLTLLIQNDRQVWEGHIARSTNQLRRTIGVKHDIKIVPIGLMVAPICIVPAECNPNNLLSAAFATRDEFQTAPELVTAACNAYRGIEEHGLLPSVLLQHSEAPESRVEFASSSAPLSDTLELMDSVAISIGESHAEIISSTTRIEILRDAIVAAENSFRSSLQRLQENKCLVVEAQQSISDLRKARQAYLEAVMDHNRAQFQLQEALGWPNSIETVNEPTPIAPSGAKQLTISR